MSDIKLCKDCKHIKKDWAGYEFAKCAVSIKCRVTGEGNWCSIERDYPSDVCGPAGKAFEPKVRRSWYAFWRAA